jgi:hypothetical protein
MPRSGSPDTEIGPAIRDGERYRAAELVAGAFGPFTWHALLCGVVDLASP